MEPATSERVGESSTRRKRPRQQIRKSLAEPPHSLPSTPRKKRKRKPETPSVAYYSVKEILDEKVEEGQTKYLIDWEDNPETGESYPPSWEPRRYVNKPSIADWESRGRQRKSEGNSRRQSPAFDQYPDSQPVRTAKRQRINRPPDPSSPSPPRRAGTAETARFQPVSHPTIGLHQRASEIKDSYEEDQPLSNDSERIRVEIPVNENFDRDAYTKVTIASSQPSQTTQNTQASQAAQRTQLSIYAVSQSQFKTPTPRRFLWDEEDEGVPIVPDSQDFPGSSSYQPSQTQTSKTGVTTRPNTGTSTDIDSFISTSRWQSSAISSDPAGLRYRHSEPPSHSSRAHILEVESETNLNRLVRSSTTGERRFDTSVEELRDGHQSRHLSNSELSGNPSPPADLSIRSATSYSVLSPELPLSFESPHRSPAAGGIRSEATSGIPNQLQPSLPEGNHEDSNLQFQTQVLLHTQEGSTNSQDNSGNISFNREHAVQTQLFTFKESGSQTLGRASQEAQLLLPTQSSASGSELTWQGAQVILNSPRLSNQQEESIYQESQIDEPEFPPRDEIPQPPTTPVLGHLDLNTQRSRPDSQEPISSQVESPFLTSSKESSHLLNHTSENVIPSIEDVVENTSSRPSRPLPPPAGLVPLSNTLKSHFSLGTSSSTARMADQTPNRSNNVANLLKDAQLKAAASKTAEQIAARAASSIPHTPPPAVKHMLPLRETAQEAPAVTTESPLSPKGLQEPEREHLATSLQILPLEENQYVVPLSMAALVRDIYNQEISNYKPQRDSFLKADEIDLKLLREIDTLIDRLKMICDHQDLIDADSATQQMESDEGMARWAENISTKCIFLAEFFDALRPCNAHVAILARPGRMMDILEALFRTHDYVYARPDRPREPTQTALGPLKITLLPTGTNHHKYVVEPASLVIAFDSTFEVEQYSNELRVDPLNTTRRALLIHLVITNSIEHLEICYDKKINPLDRRTLLLRSISKTREFVGTLDPGYLLPDDAAKTLVASLLRGAAEEPWPLLPMPDIEGIEPFREATAEPTVQGVQLSGSATQSYDSSSSTPVLQAGFKRALGAEDDAEFSKRQRLTPVDGERNSDINVSRISETIANTSDAQPNSKTVETKEFIAKPDSADDEQQHQVESFLQKIAELEHQVCYKEAIEIELRQSNQRLEARCQDYEKSFEQIQPKYQEALNDRAEFEHQANESVARELRIKQSHDARVAELTKLREQKTVVDNELAVARNTLLASSISEVAELQRVKDELNATKSENERLQKKIGIVQNDMEYMRGNYQTASSAAAEMRNELDEAKSENTVLRRKASQNSVRIHEFQASSEIKQHLETIRQLEVEKAEVERELDKKAEELRTVMNGRRPTRGTSVPRSPRMGTMSPGTSSRPMARVLSGVGSRGNSPAPGGDGAFPGRGAFGDVLFAPLPNNRWGNHLNN